MLANNVKAEPEIALERTEDFHSNMLGVTSAEGIKDETALELDSDIASSHELRLDTDFEGQIGHQEHLEVLLLQ